MNRSEWDDYDYYVNTGELKEYFEDETDYYDDERTKKTAHQPIKQEAPQKQNTAKEFLTGCALGLGLLAFMVLLCLIFR